MPEPLVLEGSQGNYTAVMGDATASCACGGYYKTSVPNQQTYTVSTSYMSSNSTLVCVPR